MQHFFSGHFIRLIVFFISLPTIFSGCSQENIKVPNVIILLTDDLGYGDIACYNQDAHPTPNIDYLAASGVKCTNFYVPTPYCAPSRETILTGRFPLRHGLVRNPTPDAGINDIGISAEEITLAEIFQSEGYRTKCIGKWHLGHKEEFFPVNHGFDEYFGILYSNDMRPVQLIENKDTIEYPVDQSLLTKRYTQKAVEFIKANKKESFFLHLCHAMPHKPLAASEDFYTPETPDNLYNDVINELDWSVGKIVQTLESENILKNTIVIFMSDNGPWYGGSTGGLKGMKATTWEGGIRVPFIIRFPELLPQNCTIDVPCWSPDIFPTLLSMTGIDSKKINRLDGIDIMDVLKGTESNHPPVFSMHNTTIMSVRKGNWKLFMNKANSKRLPADWKDKRGPDGITIIAPIVGQAGPEDYPGIVPSKPDNDIQLYNLAEDPTEDNDLADNFPEIRDSMIQYYNDFKKDINKVIPDI